MPPFSLRVFSLDERADESEHERLTAPRDNSIAIPPAFSAFTALDSLGVGMPFCKLRTSRLSFREISRICGSPGFLYVALLKLIRCDFPNRGSYLTPCYWNDMQVASESLSVDIRSRIAFVRTGLSSAGGPWESYYFRRPNKGTVIADTGGAALFLPGSRFNLMYAHARAENGLESSATYVVSFRSNGHTIATTDNVRGFDAVPGSSGQVVIGSTSELIERHAALTATASDLVTFSSFAEFIEAHDRKEKIQSDWDFARGAFVPEKVLAGGTIR